MTTIAAGVLPNGSIWMMYDHRITFKNGEYHDSPASPKCNIVGNMIFGVAGSVTATDPLIYDWVPDGGHDDPMLHMQTIVVPQVREHIGDIDEDDDFQMLVGYGRQLFYITKEFAIVPTPHWFAAIGSGSAYAVGSLFGKKPTLRSLEDAMDAAAAFDVYTSPGFSALELP